VHEVAQRAEQVGGCGAIFQELEQGPGVRNRPPLGTAAERLRFLPETQEFGPEAKFPGSELAEEAQHGYHLSAVLSSRKEEESQRVCPACTVGGERKRSAGRTRRTGSGPTPPGQRRGERGKPMGAAIGSRAARGWCGEVSESGAMVCERTTRLGLNSRDA